MGIIKYSVSKDDSVYEAWPDVVLTKNEELICVYSECKHHLDRGDTKIVIRKSFDRGKSFENKKIIAMSNIDDCYYWNCARISKLKDDSLVIIVDKILKDKNIESENVLNYIWRSDSLGEKWEGPFETKITGIVPDKVKELKSGRWITTTHHRSLDSDYLEQCAWYSDNRGEDWIGPIEVAKKNGLNLCEASILELENGTLVAFLRENSSLGLDGYKAISKDNGESWEGVYKVPLPGCHRPVSGMLNNGKILITYRFFHGGGGGWGNIMQNFFLALSDKQSAMNTERNEQKMRIMPVDYDRSKNADIGYSGWVQFDDGEIYIVTYIVDDSINGQIRGYSLREEDILIEDKENL